MAVQNGVKVRFIKNDESGLKEDQVKTLSKHDAKLLVKAKLAEYADEQPEKKQPKKDK